MQILTDAKIGTVIAYRRQVFSFKEKSDRYYICRQNQEFVLGSD
jgi:hypothetical protein